MNDQEKAKALEDVLEFALRTDIESCHIQGLCTYVSSAADKGVIADEDKGIVYDLIRDLMNFAKKSIQDAYPDNDCGITYLTEALHIKHNIPFADDKRMQKMWVEEYRDFISQLRQKAEPYLHGVEPGDRVWSVRHGWGTIDSVDLSAKYVFAVKFDAGVRDTFTRCGRQFRSDVNPTLYWDEIKFEVPKRPKPELPKLPNLAVDTPVLVRDKNTDWVPAHFAEWCGSHIKTWTGGKTSYTARAKHSWDEWKLPDEE